MSSEFDESISTYDSVICTVTKKSHSATNEYDTSFNIPEYSEINQETPSRVDTFENPAYSIATPANTHAELTASHKEKKSKKDQCGRNLVWIMISVIILLLLAVGAVAVAALIQVSKLNSEIVLCSSNVSVFESKTKVLFQNFTQLENETQNKFNKLAGLHSSFPAISCAAILQFAPFSPSGHYWIKSSNGSAVCVYCDMTRSCGNITGGWMRVASLDMRDNSSQCPSGLRQGDSCNPERTCEIGTNSPTGKCSSNSYTSHGLHYSHVCGMIRAYQVRSPDAFAHHGRQVPLNISSNYVDGVSLTHGVPHSRKHIWTFAAGGLRGPRNCDFNRPSFVENNKLFCGGRFENGERFRCYVESPLWDGKNCGPYAGCTRNDPPWFYTRLPELTSDDIEMRVCCDQPHDDEDIAIQAFEIYIQ